MNIPWPIRSTLAGTVGTATMTLAYATERRLRPKRHEPLDYDDSLVPGQIVAGIMHLANLSGQRIEIHEGFAHRLARRGFSDDEGEALPERAALFAIRHESSRVQAGPLKSEGVFPFLFCD